MRTQLFLVLAATAGVAASATVAQGELSGQLRVHDPSRIVQDGDRYYLYYTGNGVSSKYSDDLLEWHSGPRVFNSPPAWTQQEVPANNGSFWAPDIIHFDNEYRLYYSVSSFGNQDSAIGLATNVTLDSADPNYEWIDQGLVFDSEVGNSYNAIDPSVLYDDTSNRMWMTFGSYWSGIFITELDPATGKPFSASPSVINLARNPANPPDAIEGSFLYRRDGYYYLFVNWGNCCQGINSTYQIRVGRSTSPTGPFVTNSTRGNPTMVSGNGTLFLDTEGDFIGPGHMSIFSQGDVDYFTYHYYDGADFGRSKLNLRYLEWTEDGWPVAGTVVPEPSLEALALMSVLALPMGRSRRGRSPQTSRGRQR
jgi:arabinan endo-1,5-alpha-L-arabinosidase